MRFLAICLALFLVSCAMAMRSDVTRFYDPYLVNKRGSFFIEAQGQQVGSLEFSSYANEVAQEMVPLGFTRVPNVDQADYIVTFSYGVQPGREVMTSAPLYGQNYGAVTGMGYNPPGYDVVGSSVSSHTEYERGMSLRIVKKGHAAGTVFEATVKSEGMTGSFATVSRCLIHTLFKDFPGENGVTKTVLIPVAGCAKL